MDQGSDTDDQPPEEGREQEAAPTTWSAPPARLTLTADEVHVWRARVDTAPRGLASLQSVLAADERQRAARFVFSPDRDRFVVSRGILRAILARYLYVDSRLVEFRYGPHGKPELASAATDLRFNLSHSHGLALIAVTCRRRLGVDIERVQADPVVEAGAARYFSARERAEVAALPAAAQRLAIFRGWTRKEAILKATGEGLSAPLDAFEVTLGPGERPRLRTLAGDQRAAQAWSLRELQPEPGYLGALAVEGEGWRLRCWRWDEGGATAAAGKREWPGGSSPWR